MNKRLKIHVAILFMLIFLFQSEPAYSASGEIDLASIYFSRAENYLENENYPKAINFYHKAIAFAPEKFEYYQYLAFAYSITENYSKALLTYSKAYSVDSQNPYIFYNAGIILYDLGYLDEATQSFQKAIQLNPEFTDAYHNLGAIYMYMGQISEAIEHFHVANLLSPEDKQILSDLQKALQTEEKQYSQSPKISI